MFSFLSVVEVRDLMSAEAGLALVQYRRHAPSSRAPPISFSAESLAKRRLWALRVTVPALDSRERSVTLDAPSLQNIPDHSYEISSHQQMLVFNGPVHGQADRPLNDPLSDAAGRT